MINLDYWLLKEFIKFVVPKANNCFCLGSLVSFCRSYVKLQYFVTVLSLITLQGRVYIYRVYISCCSYVPYLMEICKQLLKLAKNLAYFFCGDDV